MSKKILIAEDGTLNARLLKSILEREGFVIFHAINGEVALDAINTNEFVPDLLITDIMMPKMDGFELVIKLKELQKNIPVIFISSKSDPDDIVKGMEAYCAKDYITKPFSPSECIARVKKALAT
jgi:DNA-binding response OmpR family regulator